MTKTKSTKREGGLEYKLLLKQSDLIGKLGSLVKDDRRRHVSTLFPLLDAIEDSTDTLLNLARHGKMRDSYVISRVVFETSLNTCFILAGGDEHAEHAWRHANQKMARDLDRIIQIADQTIRLKRSDADKILSRPDVQKLLSEFTSKKGREITNWTPENAHKRLEAVYLKFGKADTAGLMWGFLLYRHASDIAHGTLFGGLFAYGATEKKPKTINDLANFRAEHIKIVLQLSAFSLNSVIRIIGSHLPNKELVESSNRIQDEFGRRRAALVRK